MNFFRIPAGILRANCYVVFDELTRQAAVIDPGGDADKILAKCEENKLEVKAILLTHGHGDHVAGVADIKEATRAEIMMNKADDYLVHGGNQKLIPILSRMKVFELDRNIEDGDIIKLGDMEIEVIGTPGHTPGGVCFRIGDAVFSGDTLFRGSVGRTDLEGGSMETLLLSLRQKLCMLPDSTMVYPGHEGSTTIGEERKFNPFL